MQTSLLRLAALLIANSHAKSFALGLVGVLGTYVTQWLSGQDFGPLWTPLLAAGLPVLANSLRKLLELVGLTWDKGADKFTFKPAKQVVRTEANFAEVA